MRITRTLIERYLALEARRKALHRQAGDLEKQQKEIHAVLTDFVAANGGTERHTTRSGYLLALQSVKGQVSWKQEYIRAVGPEAAERLAANPPLRDTLVIEPIK